MLKAKLYSEKRLESSPKHVRSLVWDLKASPDARYPRLVAYPSRAYVTRAASN